MGVRGLLSHCLLGEGYVRQVDLIQASKARNGIDLLVDSDNFLYFVSEQVSDRTKEWLRLSGGEYHLLAKYISTLVTNLKKLGIHLIIYVGGGLITDDPKFDTVMDRDRKKVKTLKSLVGVLHGHRKTVTTTSKLKAIEEITQNFTPWEGEYVSAQQLKGKCPRAYNGITVTGPDTRKARPETDDISILPVLSEIQMIAAFERCGCKIRGCTDEEADRVLARDLLAKSKKSKAFAIVSNDSDFCIFKGCRFIPNALFREVMKLGWMRREDQLPEKLEVGVIDEVTVALKLRLTHAAMVELSILAGNDVTRPHIRQFLEALMEEGELKNRSFNQLAAWIRRNRKRSCADIIHHPLVRGNSLLEAAIRASREFYNCEKKQSTAQSQNKVVEETEKKQSTAQSQNKVVEETERGRFSCKIFAMHAGEYRHAILLEDCGPGHPCSEVALTPLRQYIYKMVLPEKEETVIEYGRCLMNNQLEECGKETVCATSCLKNANGCMVPVPTVDEIYPARRVDSVDQNKNLEIFHLVMMHCSLLEMPVNFFRLHGERSGFVCYILRYFLHLTKERTLRVQKEEFLALAAMTLLYRHNVSWYDDLGVRPTCRSVTVGNWYQNVYRHAYSFLGKVLSLSQLFPEPWEVYTSSVFHAFYKVRVGEAPFLSLDAEVRVRADMKSVLEEKDQMMADILLNVEW